MLVSDIKVQSNVRDPLNLINSPKRLENKSTGGNILGDGGK